MARGGGGRRVGPPTPIPSKRTLRKKVQAARAERAAKGKARAARLREPSAFRVVWSLLEEATFSEWSGEQAKPEAFWSERWRYELADGEPTWDELVDWHEAMATNRTVDRYMSRRSVSVMVLVFDPVQRMELWLTVAASGDWFRAFTEMGKKFVRWAQSYGRDGDKRSELDDDFARILEVVILLRAGDVHPGWRGHVKGLADEREAAEEKKRKRARARRKRARR